MYYYYKDATKKSLKTRAPSKKPSDYKHQSAKEWYEKQYEEYDFVIHLDGKSMEDQERIRKNKILKFSYKRISMAVEAKSWAIMWIRLEKSHNKTNACMIIKEISEHVYIYLISYQKVSLTIPKHESGLLTKQS